MARALIVGCGCRGRALGQALAEEGWAVRGTSRTPAGREEIGRAGIEPAQAEPAEPGSVLSLLGDVTALVWLLGSVPDPGLHGEQLAALLRRVVDTPVRGVVYEVPRGGDLRAGGERTVRQAGETWRYPVRTLGPDAAWPDAGVEAVLSL